MNDLSKQYQNDWLATVILVLGLMIAGVVNAQSTTFITFEGYESGVGAPPGPEGGVIASQATGPQEPFFGTYAYVIIDGWNHEPRVPLSQYQDEWASGGHAGTGTEASGWTSLDCTDPSRYVFDFQGYELDRCLCYESPSHEKYGHEERWYKRMEGVSEGTWQILDTATDPVTTIASGTLGTLGTSDDSLYMDIFYDPYNYGTSAWDPYMKATGTLIAEDDGGAFYNELIQSGSNVMDFTALSEEPPEQAVNHGAPLNEAWAIYGINKLTITPVDNWLPFVISVRTQSTDVLSHAQWVFSSDTGMMNISFPFGTSDIVHPGDSQNNIAFTITFSEPMTSASLSIPGVTWAPSNVTLTPNADATVWTGTLAGGSAPAGTDPSGIYYLHINGTDMSGNALAGRTSFVSFDRQAALDPGSGATGTDNVHRFTIATNRDIVLLLDRSGSMASLSPGFSSKMAALKDAGNIFLDILIPSSNTNLAGVKYDNVIEVLGPGCAMGPATATHIFDIRNGINDLTPRSMTSIDGGLIEAANQLSTVGDEKNLVLLFTDGKQNYPTTSVADGLAAIHALVPDNTTISAIGFGGDANINILETIVNSTNGELWITTSGLELHKFFIQALMNAGGTPYSIFIADPTVTIEQGEVEEHSFTIDSADRQVAIVVEWGNTSGLMKIRLRSPGQDGQDGQIIKMSDAVTNSRILFSGGTSYALYQLTFPLGNTGTDPLANKWEGTWQVIVDATGTESGTHEYAYSVISSSELSVKLAVIGGNFTGDKLYLLAKLLYKGQPIKGRLSAVIDYPAISIPNKLASFKVSDDALAHYKIELRNKRAKDTPISAAEVYNYAVRQKYAEQVRFPRIRVRSKFTSMPPVRKIKLGPGEFVIEVPETKVAGDYQIIVQVNSVGYKQHSPRLAFLTHVVKPQVDPQATKIEVYSEKELRFLDTRKEYPLYVKVTPQDRFGNLIGAGLLDTKQFSVKTKRARARIDSIVDRGDGTYIVALIPKKKIQSIPLRFIVQQKVKRVTITPNGRIIEEKPRIKRSYRTLRETFGSSEPDSITPQSGSSQYLETTQYQGKGKGKK